MEINDYYIIAIKRIGGISGEIYGIYSIPITIRLQPIEMVKKFIIFS